VARRGGGVVLDNLVSHKGPGAQGAICNAQA